MIDLAGQVRICMARWIYFMALFGALACHMSVVYGAEPAQAHRLLLMDHPLVDRIFDVHSKHMVDQAQLFKRLAGADYLLLGETHDNTRQLDSRNEGRLVLYPQRP